MYFGKFSYAVSYGIPMQQRLLHSNYVMFPADASPTATSALLQSVSANGFQMAVNTHASKRLDKYKAINFHVSILSCC